MLGHIYSDYLEANRKVYEDIDERIGAVRDALGKDDEHPILNDHGMEATWLDDDNLGTNSWRAIALTTVGSFPEHALDIMAWIQDYVEEIDPERTRADIPEDQLRELGYID
ncbi:MAG: hypothetical protein ABEJ77_06635 [Halanaeroarchaeum sp.]